MSSNSSKYSHKTIKPTNAAEERRAVRNPKTGRKKTSIACQHCWKSKTRCGIKRPCDRCVRLGHQDCHDRPEATRKRQHINKQKKETTPTANHNTTSVVAVAPIAQYTFSSHSGYIPSSDNAQFPPIISTPFMAMNNLVLPPFPSVTGDNSSDTTAASTSPASGAANNLFPPILDPNFGADHHNLSELMLVGDGSHSKQKKSDKKQRRERKKKTKSHKKAKRNKKQKKKKHKRKKHKTKTIDANDDEPPLKKRKMNFRDDDSLFGAQESDGHQADADCCANNEEIIYWDQPHKEIDPFSDSSHYSTEYSEDDDDDASLAVIISICRDTEKTPVESNKIQPVELKEHKEEKAPKPEHKTERKKESNNELNEDQMSEVWSHYTFTRGQLNKFISVDDNKESRCRIPFTKMVSNHRASNNLERNIYEHVMKKENNVNQDLPSVVAPVGMLMKNNEEKESSDTCFEKRCPSLPIFKAIPVKNIFTAPPRNVLCETIPNWTQMTQMSNSTTIESQTNRNVFRSFNLSFHAAPTIARITSLIPAPATNININ